MALSKAGKPAKSRRVKPDPARYRTYKMVLALMGDAATSALGAAAEKRIQEAVRELASVMGSGAAAAYLSMIAETLAAIDPHRKKPGVRQGTKRTHWELDKAVAVFGKIRHHPDVRSNEHALNCLVAVMHEMGKLPIMTEADSVKRAIRREVKQREGLSASITGSALALGKATLPRKS